MRWNASLGAFEYEEKHYDLAVEYYNAGSQSALEADDACCATSFSMVWQPPTATSSNMPVASMPTASNWRSL